MNELAVDSSDFVQSKIILPVLFSAIILHMVRLSFLSHRPHSAPYVEQMRLCLFCLWLRAIALAKKQGNAFDIANLLIALLRSADVESRYVYGTVDIPAEQLIGQQTILGVSIQGVRNGRLQ
jgi:hypothetical protein